MVETVGVSGDYLRLLHDDKWIIGLYYKSDFMKLSDYIIENRNKIIDQILD